MIKQMETQPKYTPSFAIDKNIGIAGLVKLYSDKAVSPLEYCKYLFERIERLQPQLNAFITATPEIALKAAAESEKRYCRKRQLGPLDGIPVGIKDIFDVAGVLTTYGSKACPRIPAKADCAHVERLRAAGALLMGKTNTCEFALGPMGDVSYGGPCRNPINPDKISGGSSSGSGVAVGAGLCAAATGSDAGGSIRLPASHCGLVGLKPTMGRVSAYRSAALAFPIDAVGPLTHSVEDNALMLNAMAGYDARDPFSAPAPVEDFTARLGEAVRGGRVAVAYDTINNSIDTDMRIHILDCIRKLEGMGVKMRSISLPEAMDYRNAHQRILTASVSADFRGVVERQPELVTKQVYERLTGAHFSGEELAGYQLMKRKFVEEMLALLEGCDVLMLPTTPFPPCAITDREIEVDGTPEPALTVYPRYAWIANFSGFPAITVPTGVTRDGLPTSVSLIARPFDEANLYRFADQVERNR